MVRIHAGELQNNLKMHIGTKRFMECVAEIAREEFNKTVGSLTVKAPPCQGGRCECNSRPMGQNGMVGKQAKPSDLGSEDTEGSTPSRPITI